LGALIELRSVTRVIDGFRTLSGASFTICEGEAVAIVGPSGAGKTTILRLIAGLDRPTEGEMLIDGVIADGPPHSRGIGMVFQRPSLWPHLTVRENVGFGLGRWSHSESDARIESLLDLTGLTGLARRRPHQLSGGEAQRVALARALAPRPRALLLDEPLTGLDPELHSEMLGQLSAIREQSNTALLYVSHNHDEARRVANRLIRIRRGVVEFDGLWPSDTVDRSVDCS
jgi:ABC-type Fe3+/spermidine/putrescine transport system ATPase subunit